MDWLRPQRSAHRCRRNGFDAHRVRERKHDGPDANFHDHDVRKDNNNATSAKTTTSSSSVIPKAEYNQLAVGIIDAISRGDFDAATVEFDSALRKKLPASKLSANWATYQQQFGTYQSHGNPERVQRGDLTVVNVPLQMQTTPGQFRVSFRDKDGKVAGLWFLKAGEPVP